MAEAQTQVPAKSPATRPARPNRTSARTRTAARTGTKGMVGRQVAGADTVEIKATIDDANIKKALKHLGLDPKKAEQRFVYFFDKPDLGLFASGVIVRARRVPGAQHDSTVKIRPIERDEVPSKWLKAKGFKIEADYSENGVVLSASLSRSVEKGLIKQVISGKKPVSALFDDEQELFLAEMCRVRYAIDKLSILGPVSVRWWKTTHPGVPMPMTAEHWQLDDNSTMLETSVRVATAQAAFAAAGFLAFLNEVGAKRENAQQAKTRWVLEHCARSADGAKKK